MIGVLMPCGVVEEVEIVKREEQVGAQEGGTNVPVAPDGKPFIENVTGPGDPEVTVTVSTVDVL